MTIAVTTMSIRITFCLDKYTHTQSCLALFSRKLEKGGSRLMEQVEILGLFDCFSQAID